MTVDMVALAAKLRKLALRSYLWQSVNGDAGNDALKTEGTYHRQLWRAIRDFYGGGSEFDFIDDVSAMIDNQFMRAWNAGARDVGVDPRDFTDADIAELAKRIEQEQGFMLQLADDILQAREQGKPPLESFRHRADMWAHRYEDIVNEARVYFGQMEKLEWVLGATEHCATCLALSGVVATGEEWAASGYRPQDYDSLECHGFNCLCQLVPTDKPRTRGGIPRP
jgi:hypothetical protein